MCNARRSVRLQPASARWCWVCHHTMILICLSKRYSEQVRQDEGSMSFTVTGFSDPDNDRVRLTAALHGSNYLPDWINFDAQSGRFSVAAGQGDPGSYLLDVTGSDATGANTTVTVKLDVQPQPVAVASSGSDLTQRLASYGAPVSSVVTPRRRSRVLLWLSKALVHSNCHVTATVYSPVDCLFIPDALAGTGKLRVATSGCWLVHLAAQTSGVNLCTHCGVVRWHSQRGRPRPVITRWCKIQ